VNNPSLLTVEDSSIAPGYREPISSDHSLDRMISALVPTFREASSPIPIPTYLGKEVVNREDPSGALGASNCEGGILGKTLHGRGLGYEFSPIKTRSARKKAGTNISFSANNFHQTLNRGCLEA
jgi:hypothetical protein